MKIAPGAMIGILGGGQLGRMMALAAARLGYRCHIYSPEADAPARDVAALYSCAEWQDKLALQRFAESVEVIGLEFENVPLATLEFLAQFRPVRPNAAVLAVAQDRIAEKLFAQSLSIATAPWCKVETPEALSQAFHQLAQPRAVLKTTHFGYDGKGQIGLRAGFDPDAAWGALGGGPAILEGFVEFAAEISVIAARGIDGQIALYPPVQNHHVQHILQQSLAPAPVSAEIIAQAHYYTLELANALKVEGLLAVEYFVTQNGQVLMNEIAPRPHNSGHWSQNGAITDQFEQAIRALCGLPLGDPSLYRPIKMYNLLGDDVGEWEKWLQTPGAFLHLYGKRSTRAGRKMGHVNLLWDGGAS
jgi:5-(carboxyamino)imidazole ribonucleotide synthase